MGKWRQSRMLGLFCPGRWLVKHKYFSNGWEPAPALPPDLLDLPPQSTNYKVKVWPSRGPWDPCSSSYQCPFHTCLKAFGTRPCAQGWGAPERKGVEAKLVYYSGRTRMGCRNKHSGKGSHPTPINVSFLGWQGDSVHQSHRGQV